MEILPALNMEVLSYGGIKIGRSKKFHGLKIPGIVSVGIGRLKKLKIHSNGFKKLYHPESRFKALAIN